MISQGETIPGSVNVFKLSRMLDRLATSALAKWSVETEAPMFCRVIPDFRNTVGGDPRKREVLGAGCLP